MLFYRILDADVLWTVSSSLKSFIFFLKKLAYKHMSML